MLHLVNISGKHAHKEIEDFLKTQNFIPSIYFSPFVLTTFLTHGGKNLYIASFLEEICLLVYKEESSDVRFLFHEPSSKFIASIIEHFKPNFVAVNALPEKPEKVEVASANELEIDIPTIARMTDGYVAKNYARACRNNKEIVFKSYEPKDIDSIKVFLGDWSNTRSEKQNKVAKIDNDLYFLELYGVNQSVVGGAVWDGGRVVAASLCVPALDGKAIAIINKCLRGYTELGLFTYVERAKLLYEHGYTRAYVGAVNSDFKKHFLLNGTIRELFSYELFKAPSFISSPRYLQRFF